MSPTDLACPTCGLFVHLPQLAAMSQEAQQLEPFDPAAAARVWEQCLSLLPADSEQAAALRQRIAVLTGVAGQQPPPGWVRGNGPGVQQPGGYRAASPYPLDYSAAQGPSLSTGIARTLGSMLISILIYGMFLGPAFAVGFVLLILVHEMGHVLALRYYGIRGSPPMFIPFVGAVITIPRLKDAKQEAIVGIGGPILGTIGAFFCLSLYHTFHNPILLELSFWGFAINLLNLLPFPPLDGGRVTAAVSPWIWPLGLLGLLGMLAMQFVRAGYSVSGVSPIMVLLLVIGAPRLWRTFRYRERDNEYYRIGSRSSWAIGVAYVLLGGILLGMYFYTRHLGVGF